MIFLWVHLYDKLPISFDISTMEGAINYSTFVARIAEDHSAELRERLESKQCKKRRQVIDKCLKKSDKSELPEDLKWNMVQVYGTAKDTNEMLKAKQPKTTVKEQGGKTDGTV